MGRIFNVFIERDEDGYYIGRVPDLKGCLSQGETLDELMKNIKEAIELCLEVKAEKKEDDGILTRFVGVQQIEVV